MKTFEFYQDFKVTVWRRQKFAIEAENYEGALKKVEKYKDVDAASGEYCYSTETMFETEELMMPNENDGFSTIELYDSDDNLIGCNGYEA